MFPPKFEGTGIDVIGIDVIGADVMGIDVIGIGAGIDCIGIGAGIGAADIGLAGALPATGLYDGVFIRRSSSCKASM
jgi:hypothetical protein